MLERQQSLQEGDSRNAAHRVLEAIGQAYKTEGRVLGYIARNGPHASIRFITDIVKVDVERFMDGTVTVTRTYPGEEEGTVRSKTVLNRSRIKPRNLRRLLRRNLPLPRKTSARTTK